ncbi:MAG: hypothetical protein WC942_08090 [Clostridia bacterium]|jgi:hypothetical protein
MKKKTFEKKREELFKNAEKYLGKGISVTINMDTQFHRDIQKFLEDLKEFERKSKEIVILCN